MASTWFRNPSILPGFGLTLGFTTFFLSVIVLLPLAALVFKTASLTWAEFFSILTDPRAVASYRLSFGAAMLAAVINAFFGFIVAWSLVRYDFPGRRLVDALIDLPFALPTAVSGIALAAVFSPTGWLGQKLAVAGVQVAYTWLGVVVALILIGLPFVVRSVQPALVEVQRDLEEAAETLGAGPFHVFRRIILPAVFPALLTGFTLALRARHRRVRVGRVHLRQPAAQDGDHATADRDQARAVRLQRCRGARLHHAGDVVRDAVRDQPRAGVGQAPARGGGALTWPASHPGSRSAAHVSVGTRVGRVVLITITIAFLALLLLAPLGAVLAQAFEKGLEAYFASFSDPDTRSAIRLTLLTAAIVVPANTIFGICAAWAIAKFEFRGKSLLITLIDLPFAVSPVIAGLVLVMLFGAHGWFGSWLQERDVSIIFAVPGIVLATIFVTFPYVARELIPLMQQQGSDEEEAAIMLGAGAWVTFLRITLPKIRWGLLYGVILCNARAMGEFGAVSVVSGHIRGMTTTMPLQVEILYNEYNFVAAFAVASVLALLAIVTLVIKTFVEWQADRRAG